MLGNVIYRELCFVGACLIDFSGLFYSQSLGLHFVFAVSFLIAFALP